MTVEKTVGCCAVALDRDSFLRALLRELSGALERIVGLEEASGYISLVGGAMGEAIDADYRRALGVETLSKEQVREVFVDLKRRIEGDFYVIEATADRIALGNRACPFGAYVVGRPSLCMMTSNVFGFIAAQNLGYASVEVLESIAAGDAECRVTVHLGPEGGERPGAREYFRLEQA